jgi:TusA-related sulfurtransferase
MGMEHLLDVRNLEQPEPLLRALAELESLASGDYLRMLCHRDPVLLYPMLLSQGFSYRQQRDSAGIYEILVWHRGDAAAEQAARS